MGNRAGKGMEGNDRWKALVDRVVDRSVGSSLLGRLIIMTTSFVDCLIAGPVGGMVG